MLKLVNLQPKCDKIQNSLVEIEDDELSSTSVDSKY